MVKAVSQIYILFVSQFSNLLFTFYTTFVVVDFKHFIHLTYDKLGTCLMLSFVKYLLKTK